MGQSTSPHNPFIGAWELVSGFYTDEHGVQINYGAAEVKSIKVLSATKFSFTTHASGAFYAAGAGDYNVENGLYTEIPALASAPGMIGQKYVFQYELKDDTWTNSRWQEGVLVESEIWKRLQP